MVTIELYNCSSETKMEVITFLESKCVQYKIKDDVVTDDLSWVKNEYCSLFKVYGHMPYERECKARIQKLIKKEHITKDEILKATKLYLSKENPKYIKRPHYFLLKDSDSTLLTWIDFLKNIDENIPKRDITETLQ